LEKTIDFFERVQKLRWIERCSNTQHVKSYSVAQHSFYVALYGLVFSLMENERIGTAYYSTEEIVKRSLVHDLEESETGDILFPLHNKYPEFKERLDFIRDECVERDVFRELPEDVSFVLSHLWKRAKDPSTSGRMVACMDKFEILMFAVSELEIGNNLMRRIYENAIRIIKEEFSGIESVISVIKEIEAVHGVVV
jgi:5'-deoxynucleotidase YfbR-like HD superfamily hydrolase